MATRLNFASLEERVRFGGETLLRSSDAENDDAKHHHELFRHSELTNGKVEPTMKRILKDLGERHLTDDKTFSCQTLK